MKVVSRESKHSGSGQNRKTWKIEDSKWFWKALKLRAALTIVWRFWTKIDFSFDCSKITFRSWYYWLVPKIIKTHFISPKYATCGVSKKCIVADALVITLRGIG